MKRTSPSTERYHLYAKLKHLYRALIKRSISIPRWFSGRISACHAGDPGSIPGRGDFFLVSINGNVFLGQIALFLRAEEFIALWVFVRGRVKPHHHYIRL